MYKEKAVVSVAQERARSTVPQRLKQADTPGSSIQVPHGENDRSDVSPKETSTTTVPLQFRERQEEARRQVMVGQTGYCVAYCCRADKMYDWLPDAQLKWGRTMQAQCYSLASSLQQLVGTHASFHQLGAKH